MITWIAKYTDGQVLTQFTGDGEKVSADNIDRQLVESFSLLDEDKVIFTLHLDPGQRLVYRRRVAKTVGGTDEACHIVGYRYDIMFGDGINPGTKVTMQSMCCVFEDGHVEMIGDFREDHPWFYSPQLREFEK